jgi:hypothetical protein
MVEEWIALGTGATAAAATMFRYIRKGLRAAASAQQKLDQIARLSEELRPNGGTSLRDAINRIEGNMATVQAKMRMMFRHSEVNAFEANIAGEWTCVTGDFADRVGFEDEQLLGFGWMNAIHPSDQDRVYTEWIKAIDQNRDWLCTFATRHAETGLTMEHRVRAHRVLRNGELCGYLGILELDTSEEETT